MDLQESRLPYSGVEWIDAPRPAAVDSAHCRASDLLRWAGMAPDALADTQGIQFVVRRVPALSVLMHEGHDLNNLYFVSAGSFKVVQFDAEGYEQVLDFALRGDCIGLDALGNGQHTSSAIALEDSAVACVPFRDLVALGHRVPALERLLHHATGIELMRRSQSQYLMAAASAEVRVARFLANFGLRQAEMGFSGRRFRLRMSRRDIASHLGLAHETISRALTMLEQWGLIAVDQRDVEIIDAQGLHELQRITRGTLRGALRVHPVAPTAQVRAQALAA